MTTSVNKIRRNVHDKLKLIKMVNDHRILWDSRLPNFKGAEEEKTHAWQLIGNEFGVPGRRVARAFKSLRESYRRELALVKTMGEGFQSKWGLFVAMDFLREVIRERKSTTVTHDGSLNLNNKSANNYSNNNISTKSLNRSSISMSDDYSYFVKAEPADHDLHDDTNPDNHISSTLNGNYDDIDDMTSDDSNQVHRPAIITKQQQQNHHHNTQTSSNNGPNSGGGNDVEELEAIDADFPYPLIIDNSPPSPSSGKRKRHNSSSDDDINPYEQQQQHQQMSSAAKIQPTVREVLNSKFCGFITAKLNSMDDSEADNLMNRILMLLVQTQTQTVNGNAK
ncbi:uncharacterized protein LOC129919549 isoform X2 [Episyrphus balteatus]|uniref:uncharacterized protein LOC129919549 isoform X2 n=1 Tax=Episyrphus balteatus TaxID=286459 RepID=UPI0024866A9D|nr:uncharacterized protein LOC129919549 isoform X2 [Episyrphus balteatus]